MVLFTDAVLTHTANQRGWHSDKPAGNVLLADGHGEFRTALAVTNLIW